MCSRYVFSHASRWGSWTYNNFIAYSTHIFCRATSMEIEHAFRSFNPPDETLSLLLTHWSWPGRGSVVKDILPGKTTGKAGNNKALGTSINGRTCDWNHVLNWGICADVECSISRASPCKPLYQNTVNEVGLSGRFCPRQPLFSVTLSPFSLFLPFLSRECLWIPIPFPRGCIFLYF